MAAKFILTVSALAVKIGLVTTAIFAHLPGAQIFLSRPTAVEIMAYGLLIVSCYFLRRKGGKIAFAFSLLVLIGRADRIF